VLRNLQARPEVLAHMGVQARQVLCDHYGLQRALDSWIAVIGAR
jgi:hypothetical protein